MDINGSGEKRRLWASVEHQASAENFRQIAGSRGWSTCWLQIQGFPTPYYSLMKSAPRHQVERPFCSPTTSSTPCMCPPFLESCVTGVVFAWLLIHLYAFPHFPADLLLLHGFLRFFLSLCLAICFHPDAAPLGCKKMAVVLRHTWTFKEKL